MHSTKLQQNNSTTAANEVIVLQKDLRLENVECKQAPLPRFDCSFEKVKEKSEKLL